MSLDFAAAHLAGHRGADVTVLQVGAFDGLTNDPVLDAPRRYGWRGVLVEPQPAPFADLQALHTGDPRIQVVNAAISDRDGTRALFTLDPVEDLPSWAQQISSFRREHLEGQQQWLPDGVVAERLTALEVETLTFDTLLERTGTATVDVLQIDTEGYDWEVLRLFDLPAREPAIVHYEHVHLGEPDRARALELLWANGYRTARCGPDTLGYRC